MGSTGVGDNLDSLFCEAMLESVAENLPSRPRSTKLFFSGRKTYDENTPHDIHTADRYVLPDRAVALIFSHLPLKDVFRFGFKLSKGWLDVWKRIPLVMHDAQLVPDHVKGQIVMGGLCRYNIASAVTRILDLHPGPVAYIRLEYTTWKNGCIQVRLWIEKLISKRVSELVLFGRLQQADLDLLPNNIVHCNQLRRLTLCFLKIPKISLDDPFSLHELREVTVVDCDLQESDITVLLMKCSKLKLLSLGHMNKEVITVSSYSLSLLQLWNCRIKRLFIIDCPKLSTVTQMIERDSQHETQISISATPGIRVISHLYLKQQTLYIDDHQITIGMEHHPHYSALQYLTMGVRFFGNYELDVICELLRSFPSLITLEITRLDPNHRCLTASIKWKDLIQGIRCVKYKLQKFSLFNSGLDDTEIELAQSILMYASNLRSFSVLFSACASAEAREKWKCVIEETTSASKSVTRLQNGPAPRLTLN